jgi:hypothetical protein
MAAGLIVRDCPVRPATGACPESLPDYLRAPRRGRDRGHRHPQADAHPARKGRPARRHRRRPDDAGEAAIELARSFPGMQGLDLARKSPRGQPTSGPRAVGTWMPGAWRAADRVFGRHVVAYDFGVKRNILRMLADRGCRVTVVPATTPAADVLALNPDGMFLSNGPAIRNPAITPSRRSASCSQPECRCSASASATSCWPGGGRPHRQDEVRPPRRQPPGAGPRQRACHDHQPEPRFRGRREPACPRTCAPPTARCSTARCRASN